MKDNSEKIVLSALNFYGDICYEYAQQIWGEEGAEMMSSGEKEFSKEDEDMLMGEALCMVSPRLTDKEIETAKKYWKKYFT